MFKFTVTLSVRGSAGLIAAALLSTITAPAMASPFPLFPFVDVPAQQMAYAPVEQPQSLPQQGSQQFDPEDQVTATELPAHLKRQIVTYPTREAPGTIVIDTGHTYLYYVLGGGRALRYGIGVGREGFTWSGVQSVTRKAEWPDWTPPAEMIARQPYLPRYMAGGPGNPLGARAMYLGGTIYRIHGTNNPATIGGRVSSGCIRMTNEDVTDLYSRVNLGAKVVVMPIERRADLSGATH